MWVTGEYYDALRDVATAARGRLDAAAQPSPFDRIDWFARTLAFAPPGRRPLVVRSRIGAAESWLFLARARADRLTALAGRHTLRFAPIFTAANDDPIRLTLVAAAARRLRTFGTNRITLPPMLAEHESILRRGFARAGWVARSRTAPANHLLHVIEPGFDDYWDHRPDRLHDQVAAGSRHLLVEIADRLTPRLWDEIELIDGTDAFLRALADDASAVGTLRIGVVRIGDAPIGAQLWTVESGAAVCHWRAEDTDAAKYHPFAQLTASMLRYLINVDHIALAELGNGADFADWASDSRAMRRLDLLNPRAPSSWAPALAAALVRRAPLD